MRAKFLGCLSIFLLICLFATAVSATTYYVDKNHPQASDENPGTEDLPWKTINHAAEVLQAGDTVLVKEGRYNVGASPAWSVPAINPVNSGTPENPITFKVYPGHKVTVFVSEGHAAIGSNGKNYIIWDGFTVEMFGRMKGILLMNTKGCIIQNCTVIGDYIDTGDNHDGIRGENSTNLTIKNCIIHGIRGKSHDSAGIKFYGVHFATVEHNLIYDCETGIQPKGKDGSNNKFRYNIVHNCGNAFFICYHKNNEVYQNIIYECHNGFSLACNINGFDIYNNIIHNCVYGVNTWSQKEHDNIWFFNNVFVNSDAPFKIVSGNIGHIFSDYNCFYDYTRFLIDWTNIGLLPAWQNRGFDQHSIEAAPLFVNAEANDFHLRPNSPCLAKEGEDCGGIDKQDYDGDGDTTERINMGAYITGDEIIGPILNQGPQVNNESPARNATDALKDTKISFDITDSDGVNQSSISVSVNGNNVTQNCTITAISNGFHVLYDPSEDFDYRQDVTVLVTATDGLGNTTNDSWSFKIKQLSDVIGFDASLNGSSVKLSWEVPDDPDYAGVEIRCFSSPDHNYKYTQQIIEKAPLFAE